MMNEWIYLAMSVSMGLLVVSYAYFTVNKHIATVERHEREREERNSELLKPAKR